MTLQSRFPGTCVACGHRFPAGTEVNWERGKGARHVRCPPALPVPEPVVKIDLSGLVAFLNGAKDRGLKHPKVRFLSPSRGELRLSISGPNSRVPGSVQVVEHDVWIGRVQPDGGVSEGVALRPDLLMCLVLIGQDPAAAAKAYGALMCRCSFCGLPLTDAGSVLVGYGPICAKRYGLPHVAFGTPDVSVPKA